MNTENSNQRNFKPAYLVALVLLLLVAIVLIIPKTEPDQPDQTEQSDQSQTVGATNPEGVIDEEILVEVEGVALTGAEIGRDYCAEGLYLVPNDSDFPTVLMREVKGDETVGMVDGYKYVGEEVIVTGLYTPLKAMCMALMCDCEDFIIVDSIEII